MIRVWLCAALLLVSACSPAPKKASDVRDSDRAVIGKSMRVLQLKSLGDVNFSYSPKPQKPLIVNVWATWCAPCIKELPNLLKLQKQGDYGVLTISIDRDADTVKSFLQKNKLMELSVVLDSNGSSINEKFSLRGVPTTYIVDTDWVVRGIEMGERDWTHPSMQKKIQQMLSPQG